MLEPEPFEKVMYIDPPSGWKYGFPKFLPEGWRNEDFDLRSWLIENGYPEEDVDFGMKHCRWFGGTVYG